MKLMKIAKHLIFGMLMLAILARAFYIGMKLTDDPVSSWIAAIFASILLYGIGYLKDRKTIFFVALIEILLTLTIFWFEVSNISHQKDKELSLYNEKKQKLIDEKFNELIEKRKNEIQERTIAIPEPIFKACPTQYYWEECELKIKKAREENKKKYAKEIEFNFQLQSIPYPDRNKIEVFVPYPSDDKLQRILISLLFNLSIPVLYYLIGSLLMVKELSTMDEAVKRYQNRTDETVEEICNDLGIASSSFYKYMERKKKAMEKNPQVVEETENPGKIIGEAWEKGGIIQNPFGEDWNFGSNVWRSIGERWNPFGERWNSNGKRNILNKRSEKDGFK